jgi:hypothetical protein
MEAPWRDRSVPLMTRCGPTALATALCVSLGSACTFAPGGPPGGGGDDDGTMVDASPDLPDGRPPLPCDEPIHAEFTINGMPAVGAGPIATVLIGDTVRLDATGSCSQRGEVRYLWEFGGGELLESAEPGDRSQRLTVYPSLPGDFDITLTVSDDEGSADPVTVSGIRSIGWTELASGIDVRDLAVGRGAVWIASNQGPRFIDLADVSAGVQDVNANADGEQIPGDLNAVAFSPVTGQVWFGSQGQFGAIWRVSVPSLSARFTTALVSLPTELASARVRDISPQGQGVSIATDGGVAVSPLGGPFDPPTFTGSFHAVAENLAGGWAGGDDGVFRLSTPDLPPLEPFPGENKIRALAGDADNLWAGSDGNGVARIGSDDMADLFSPANTDQELPSDQARAIAVDDARDAWVATQNGVGRYKRDLQTWVAMQSNTGIGRNDLRAVAALRGGERVYVVASGGGGGVISILRFAPP